MDVRFDPAPIAIHEMIHHEREFRGHFNSLLFRCFLPGSFTPKNEGLTSGNAGYIAWHGHCPEDLLRFYEIYREYIAVPAPEY